MFVMGCQDASPAVSAAAMSATASYIRAISSEPEVLQLQGVISPLLGVMHNCLVRGDEDLVVEALDMLGECVDMEQPLINDHVEVSLLPLSYGL
jgi:hypothetical protein